MVALAVLGAVVVLCGGARAQTQPGSAAADDVFWDSVKTCEHADEVGAYTAQFPRGRHLPKALECLTRLETLPPGTEFQHCPLCPKMVVVPAGSFMMASPPDEEGRDDHEGPQHRVTIGDAFAVGKYEVAFDEWDACVAAGDCSRRPSDPGWPRGRRPVTGVSWNDAQDYVRWLSGHTGKRYRLLSEAEWEYAARAGTVTRFHWGDAVGENRANCDGCGSRWYSNRIAPIGSFSPNGFGLHDMHGNVSEWVEDCLTENYEGRLGIPAAAKMGDCSLRVQRSGSWRSAPRHARSANRDWHPPLAYLSDFGFRVALTVSPP